MTTSVAISNPFVELADPSAARAWIAAQTDVCTLRDVARAVEAARRAVDNSDARRVYFTELAIYADSRLGQVIKDGMASGAIAAPGKRSHDATSIILSELGINKSQSSRCQRIAEVGEERLEQVIETVVESGEELTKAAVLRHIQRESNKTQPKNGARPATQIDGFCTTFDEVLGLGVKFGCIYADPPWRYSNQGTRAATDNHYGTMTVDEICALPVKDIAADKCHLHLWTTNGFLFECPKIFAAWGFEFKSSFVWVKPQMGIGNYWRNSHEILLTAVRGGLTAQDKGQMSWLQCSRGQHSAKPEQVRERIQKLSPGPYLEMFGRRKVPGWHVFGNQVLDALL